MVWIIEPLKGFNELGPVLNDSCENQWAKFTCIKG